MARFDRHGGRLPTSFFEAAAWHHFVIVTCRGCGREAVFNPHALWWLFERKGWDGRFRVAAKRFKCERCGGSAQVTWGRDRVATVPLPMPCEREWKRAVNRFRN